MREIQGHFNTAKVFTNNIEKTAEAQIKELCNQEFIKDSKIRIMPDTHAGAGCVIGTTMTIKNKIVPNLVGVDIGCGMLVAPISEYAEQIPLPKLDEIIRKYVPSGFNVQDTPKVKPLDIQHLRYLRCAEHVNVDRALHSVGTLGGGNHFIEVNLDHTGKQYIVIHTGSRNIGKQVADYYQNKAIQECSNKSNKDIIRVLKLLGREKEIQAELEKQTIKAPPHLAYLEGDSFNDYIHDMGIIQDYASINRHSILDTILNSLYGIWSAKPFETIHNYIDTKTMILRKGAISAQKDEIAIIPINMRDGSLLVKGKGNKDWNCSAPHGAGRIMSRKQAKERINLKDYQDTMQGVYSTSISQDTIDEAPFAYKPIEEIIENTQDTVELLKLLKPIYNFKASK